MRPQPDLALQGLVHDLNNVFTTIMDTAFLMGNDARWAGAAAVLERNVMLGQRILNSFVEAGGAPMNLNAVLQSAQEFASDFLQAQGAEIEFLCECEPDLQLRGSPIAWERAIFNLLINAGQAMGRGTVEIQAHGREDAIELTVADYGSGIPDEHLTRVFEPGFSTKPARSGFGLHIVASIVKQNGGAITAANRENAHGAVFRILAPPA